MTHPTTTWRKSLEKLMLKFCLKNGDWNVIDGYIPLESFIAEILGKELEGLMEEFERQIGITFDKEGQIEVDMNTGQPINEYLNKNSIRTLLAERIGKI